MTTGRKSRPPKQRNSGLPESMIVLHTMVADTPPTKERISSMTRVLDPIFDGIYMVIILDAKEGVSKNGNPYVDMTLVIANAVDPEHIGYTVRFQKLYFTEKSM